MKKFNIIFLLLVASLLVRAQYQHPRVYSTFDNLKLAKTDTFDNGSDLTGEIEHYGRHFLNSFDTTYKTWAGWALSNRTDDTTADYTNQESVISGHGVSYTSNYMVGFYNPTIVLDEATSISGAYFTNSTYAYYDMLNGSGFSKRFGGSTGNDSDFFKIIVKCYLNGEFQDSNELFLADYRFTDNSKDYILDDWTYLDFNGDDATDVNTDSIVFDFASSDNGQFGMNTPAYFCMDDFNAISNLASHVKYSNYLPLASNSYDNGSDGAGGFLHQYGFFPNVYNQDWGVWEGWSVSSYYDNTDSSFLNSFSPVEKVDQSNDANACYIHYGQTNEIRAPYIDSSSKNAFYKLNLPPPWKLDFLFTNTIYAYYDMKHGSNFSKKFGGIDGNDPDFFRIIITWLDDQNSLLNQDTVYLADFRSSDNSNDYILDQWVNYSWDNQNEKMKAHKIHFEMQSSDTGSFGINTPQFFAMAIDYGIGSVGKNTIIPVQIHPNPASSFINVSSQYHINNIKILDLMGKTLIETTERRVFLDALIAGIYIIEVETEEGLVNHKFIKQ